MSRRRASRKNLHHVCGFPAKSVVGALRDEADAVSGKFIMLNHLKKRENQGL